MPFRRARVWLAVLPLGVLAAGCSVGSAGIVASAGLTSSGQVAPSSDPDSSRPSNDGDDAETRESADDRAMESEMVQSSTPIAPTGANAGARGTQSETEQYSPERGYLYSTYDPSGNYSIASVDLGVGEPLTIPECDGRGIVVLYSAVVPGQYKSEIRAALNQFPGSRYLRTDHACGSLRQRDDKGNVIYAVYRPSGYTQSEVCADVRAAGGGAYGRWLSATLPPTHRITC